MMTKEKTKYLEKGFKKLWKVTYEGIIGLEI